MAQPVKKANQELNQKIIDWLNGREFFSVKELRIANGCYSSDPLEYKANEQIKAILYRLRKNGAIQLYKGIKKVGKHQRMRIITMNDLRNYTPGMDTASMPPKEIAGAIHGACFDYQDIERELGLIENQTIEQRIYNCWQMIHHIVLQDPEGFVEFIRKQKPDLSYWEKLTRASPITFFPLK